MSTAIRRGFVDIAEGQVHFRGAGEQHGGVPLVLLHASPGSAKTLEPLLGALGASRRVLAPDTLGNGDSAPPQGGEQPEIAYFADAHRRALDALGLDRFDLYGTHTGANLAVEIALAAPHRVRRLILDGVSLYSAEEQADMLAHYTPEVPLDQLGSQFNQVWHFVRDAYLFWPWYRREAGNRRPVGLPSAEDLHDKAVEVLKSVRTYHLSYRAAFRYRKETRLPLLTVPTLLACARTDMLLAYFDQVRQLVPAARAVVTPGLGSPAALQETVGLFLAFLGEASGCCTDADLPASAGHGTLG
jgi:pimeloyl-ACP methyl ester carboxylesterase